MKLNDLKPDLTCRRLFVSFNGSLMIPKSFGVVDDWYIEEDADNVYIYIHKSETAKPDKSHAIYIGNKYTRPYCSKWKKTTTPVYFEKWIKGLWIGTLSKTGEENI
mgnify:CR=1 FL=1